MNIKTIFDDYALIDTGDGEKLERFGVSPSLRRYGERASLRSSGQMLLTPHLCAIVAVRSVASGD